MPLPLPVQRAAPGNIALSAKARSARQLQLLREGAEAEPGLHVGGELPVAGQHHPSAGEAARTVSSPIQIAVMVRRSTDT